MLMQPNPPTAHTRDKVAPRTDKQYLADKAITGLSVGGRGRNDGWLRLGRPRHLKRIKKELFDIGTWNVNTVLKTGKMQEVADQIVGSQI
jgi:hypothetical protein